MSPNSDNAMARFLFAILKQKNLKDVSIHSSPSLFCGKTENEGVLTSNYSRLTGTKLLKIPSFCNPLRMDMLLE
jgi:hypothetical protein